MALVRAEVIRTALRLLDDVGLDNLSLRKLATELGIQAPTLYWHFKNKQALLDEMAATTMAEVDGDEELPVPGAAWDEWLAWMARRIRRGMLAHRDGALLVSASRPAPDRWHYVDGILVALQEAGFTPASAIGGVGVLTTYVLGTTLEEQQAAKHGDSGGPADIENYPALCAALSADVDHEQRFEHGLRLILDGMGAQLTPTPNPA